MRATTLVVRYVKAAVVAGAGGLRIVVRHILPNSLAPLIVQTTFVFAYAVVAEAVLSFLGVGAQPPTPSWGNIITEGRNYIRDAWWITLFTGLAIAATVLGLVGESGSGKSVTALAMMGLLPAPAAPVLAGSIRLAGADLLRLRRPALRRLRGSAVSMIFQEPMTSRNPVLTIGTQLTETTSPTRASACAPPANAPSACSTASASSRRPRARRNTRIAFPAARGSG